MRDHLQFPRRPTGPRGIFVIAAIGAVAIAAIGLVSRVIAGQDAARWTESAAIPTVSVIGLADANRTRSLVLPGDIEAFYSAPVHARATGYLNRWYTDIGTAVKKGQVLADIDTPDLDQQLEQARGQLGTAVANENLAALTAKRYLALKAQNAIALELVDQQVGTWEADKAATEAARANVKYLQAQESFKHLVAPFDGVVTSRSTDVGALITVGTPTDVPLFTVADEHMLRIYVRVPQNSAALVKPGATGTFSVPQYPGRSFTATLATTSQAVDATSGTLLVEFQTDNADGALKPGEYAQMHIVLSNQSGTMIIPASALIFRDGGMSVATVDIHDRVSLRRVTIGRDLGSTVEISYGLSRADRVVDNPPDSLRDGDVVHIGSLNRPPRPAET